LNLICGAFDDDALLALLAKEAEIDAIIKRLQDKYDDLTRRIKKATEDPWGKYTGNYVPRAQPEDWDNWDLVDQLAWLLEEERRRNAAAEIPVEDR